MTDYAAAPLVERQLDREGARKQGKRDAEVGLRVSPAIEVPMALLLLVPRKAPTMITLEQLLDGLQVTMGPVAMHTLRRHGAIDSRRRQ